MNPRLATVLLLAFVAMLVFIGWVVTTRRSRRANIEAEQRARIKQYQELVSEVADIASGATDVDPSAELIFMRISDFRKKELL
jgi:hypothetical protein